jgi:hypothetical protein
MKPADMFHCYRRGWTDGAKATAMATQHSNPELRDAYEAGYHDGYKARCAASTKASIMYGYFPSPLRTES